MPVVRSTSCQRSANSSPRLSSVASARAIGHRSGGRRRGEQLPGLLVTQRLHLALLDLRALDVLGRVDGDQPQLPSPLHGVVKETMEVQHGLWRQPAVPVQAPALERIAVEVLDVHRSELAQLVRPELRHQVLVYDLGVALMRVRRDGVPSLLDPLLEPSTDRQIAGVGDHALVDDTEEFPEFASGTWPNHSRCSRAAPTDPVKMLPASGLPSGVQFSKGLLMVKDRLLLEKPPQARRAG